MAVVKFSTPAWAPDGQIFRLVSQWKYGGRLTDSSAVSLPDIKREICQEAARQRLTYSDQDIALIPICLAKAVYNSVLEPAK